MIMWSKGKSHTAGENVGNGGWTIRFYVLFNIISVTSGRLEGNNEGLCAVKLRLRLERFPSPSGLEPGTGEFTVLFSEGKGALNLPLPHL